jgi:DNA-binding MarR family transcriptional regulator
MPRPSKTRHAAGEPGPACNLLCDMPGPVLDLSSHIATKVAILANRLSRAASRYYRKRYGIGVVEWRLVMFIGQVVETRANRICSETELDKGAVSRSLAVLQRLGLVRIEEDGADSRRNNITLTPKGRRLHDEMVPIALDRQSELVASLTQTEIETFVELIDRLQASIADDGLLGDEPTHSSPVPPPRSHQPPRAASDRATPRRRRGAQLARQD